MYGTLAMVHNAVAWVVLGVGAYVVVRGASARGGWSAGDSAWVKRLVLAVHLQLVAGLVLWFVSPAVQAATAPAIGSSTAHSPWTTNTTPRIRPIRPAVASIAPAHWRCMVALNRGSALSQLRRPASFPASVTACAVIS